MRKFLSLLRKAVQDFDMIQNSDTIAVGVSGGKDSTALLAVLNAYRKFSEEKFDLIAIHIDMNFKEGTDKSALIDYCTKIEGPLFIEKTEIAEILFDDRKASNPCSLCSKMRRGALNGAAIREGANKLALAHHSDDLLCTMLLSFIFEGRLSTFSPVSFMDRSKITLIRPFIYVEEKNIEPLIKKYSLPTFKNPCPEDKNTKREYMNDLIKKITKDIPFAKDRMKSALFHPERNNLWNLPKNTKK